MSAGIGDRPVVLVHGYRDDASVFDALSSSLKTCGRQAWAVTLTPSDGRAPLEVLAGQLQEAIALRFPPDQTLDFVGFSMGGILVRYFLQRLGGLERTVRFLSVGTPHHGTWTAFASRRPTACQLRPGSDFLRDLAADADRLAGIRFGSLWTPTDLMIFPPTSSLMTVGANLRLVVPYHKALVTSRRGVRAVSRWMCVNRRQV